MKGSISLAMLLAATTALAGDPPGLATDEPDRVLPHLRSMLAAGDEFGRSNLQAAQRHYEEAQRAARDVSDVRLPYAYGLVLLRQHQYPLAAEQFALAARADEPYWPAWRALIWTNLSAKQYPDALKQLTEYARRLKAASVDDAVQQDAAFWMGQVIEGLRKSAGTSALLESVTQQDRALRDLLGEELLTHYEQGRWFVQGRYSQLKQDLARVRQETIQQQQTEKQDEKQRIATDQQGVEQQQETLLKTREEWKKWLDEQTAAFDRQLGLLEKEYTHLENQNVSLTQSMVLLAREITALQVGAAAARGTQQTPVSLLIDQRELQMVAYQTEQARNLQQMGAVRQRAALVLQQRAAVVRRYEQETGNLVKQNQSLRKWSERLKQEEKRIAETPVGKSQRLRSLSNRLHSIGSYVELDFDIEKERLLASYEP